MFEMYDPFMGQQCLLTNSLLCFLLQYSILCHDIFLNFLDYLEKLCIRRYYHIDLSQQQQEFNMDIGIEQMSRYVTPVNPAVYPHLTLILLGIGIFFTAWFFVYEVTSTKYTRDLYKELLVALFAALFMGFGTVFLLLWVGIYI